MSDDRKTYCYRVKVVTTNAVGNAVEFANGALMACDERTIYVTTQNPEDIYTSVGSERIVSVERIGIGYHIMRPTP